MVSIYDLKPAFQKLLSPLVAGLAKNKVTPNQITVFALLLSVAGGAVLTLYPTRQWVLLVLPTLLLVRMALNALDGMLARQYQLSTKTGEVLNELGDVVADACLYMPLVFYLPQSPTSWIVIGLFVYLGLMSEFCGVLAKAIIGVRRYEGPMGKSDRALLVGLYSIALYIWPSFMQYGSCVFGFACILLLLSMMNRLKGIASGASA